jgi:deazaflavin-dependent oxidoreductase (nitroreductase family)
MGWNDTVIEQFLEGRTRIVDTFDRDALILLDTTGARTGQRRTSPVACFEDGERLLVIASKAGADTHPAWFHNLVANPEVSVRRWENDEMVAFDATADVLPDDERDNTWRWIVARAPGFGAYQTKTDRVIPVVSLQPHR